MSFHTSLRRKMAIATWSAPREGNIYGKLSIDMSNALSYLSYLRKLYEEKVTITHMIGKAAGLAFAQCPDINGRIFLGKYIPHKTVDIAFLVSVDGGKDLGKFKVNNIDQKAIVDVARELSLGADKLRKGQDGEFEKSKKYLRIFPSWLIKPMLWLTGYITGAMGIDIKSLGLEKFPFGAAIITNVGMFGLDEGFAPPTPFARVPIYLTIPEIKKQAVVVDNKVVIRPILNLTATIDHRFLDGHRGAMVAKIMRNLLEKPWLIDGLDYPPEAMPTAI